jgi:hypothetical protein
VRVSSSAITAYSAWVNQSNVVELYKWVAGAMTLLGSSTGFSDGETLRLEVVGTSITVKRAGSVVISVTDSAIASGSAGLLGSGAVGECLDNWEGGSLAAGGPTLDMWHPEIGRRPASKHEVIAY